MDAARASKKASKLYHTDIDTGALPLSPHSIFPRGYVLFHEKAISLLFSSSRPARVLLASPRPCSYENSGKYTSARVARLDWLSGS